MFGLWFILQWEGRLNKVTHKNIWNNLHFALLTIGLTFCALLLAAIPAAAQTNLTGVWESDLSMGDGNILRAYLDLQQERRPDYRRVLV